MDARIYLDDLSIMTGLTRYNELAQMCTDLGIDTFPDRQREDMYISRVDTFQLLRHHLGYLNNTIFWSVRNIEVVV